MDPADGRHQVYTMDVWDRRHRMLKSWNHVIFCFLGVLAPSAFPALLLDGS